MNNPLEQQLSNNAKSSQKLHYFYDDIYQVFLHYKEGHPINLKQKFHFGSLRIFDESKMYYRELYSTINLNTQLDWTQQYFNKIIESFQKYEIKKRIDIDDQTLDFIVRGDWQQKQNEILLISPLQEDFGKDIQKQFWREFENYNNSKNQQIAKYQQLRKQNIKNKEKKIQQIKKYYEFAEAEKKVLIGRLSAILSQKVNKLREFQEDYNIELFEDKLKKYKEEQQRNLSTFQEQGQMGSTLFQASQDLRQDFS